MRVIDVAALASRESSASADICIIGAGAAGIYLARKLVALGADVSLIEAGGNAPSDVVPIDLEPAQGADVYAGATARAFGFGGTTAIWGGQLLPYSTLDLRASDDGAAVAWAQIVETVEQHSQAVYTQLRVKPPPAGKESVANHFSVMATLAQSHAFELLASEWLPFRYRNFRWLLSEEAAERGSLSLYLRACATEWIFSNRRGDDVRAVAVRACSPNGNELRVTAKQFVLAAGTLESTRILLEMDETLRGQLRRTSTTLGRGLADHLSCRIGAVAPAARRRLIEWVGPRFANGRMKTLRFVERDVAPGMPRGFFHFEFDHGTPGLEVARKLLQALQVRSWPRATPREVLRALPGLLNLGYARYARGRLALNPAAPLFIRLDVEQLQAEENGLALAEERDRLGRKKMLIRWRVTDGDVMNLREAARRFSSKWKRMAPDVEIQPVSAADELIGKVADTYHPVGTCRIGREAEGVVSPTLRVHGLGNVFVLSTAIFPSAGTANPTFSLLCFAEALAQTLVSNETYT